MASIVLLLLVALTQLANVPCQASSHYQAYETVSERVEGNSKLKAEKIFIIVDSKDEAPKPSVKVKNYLDGYDRSPSTGSKATSNDNVESKRIKLYLPKTNAWFHGQNMIGNAADYDTSSLNSITGHQSFTRLRPRTVESPALSVDTGQGRSSHPSVRLANGIKKLFNVEEGHYTDIYDRIDKHKPINKKKPAEKIDERLGLAPRH